MPGESQDGCKSPVNIPTHSILKEAHLANAVSGIEPGQRQLNGPQTSGRDYRNLSQPEFELLRDEDVAVPMRDGIELMADVYRPSTPGRSSLLRRPTHGRFRTSARHSGLSKRGPVTSSCLAATFT